MAGSNDQREFDFEFIHLYSTNTADNQQYVDLSDVWVTLELEEDIHSPSLSATLVLLDGSGMHEDLLGEEFIHFKYRTFVNDLTIQQTNFSEYIEEKMRVYKVLKPEPLNPSTNILTIQLVSDAFLKNKRSKVFKSWGFRGGIPNRPNGVAISEMVKDIFTDKIISYDTTSSASAIIAAAQDGPEPKPLIIEETELRNQFCISNKTPFQALSFLAKKSVSSNLKSVVQYSRRNGVEFERELAPAASSDGQSSIDVLNSSTFYYYETTKGYYFVSVERLFRGILSPNPIQTLYYAPKSLAEDQAIPREQVFNMVDQYDILKTFNVLENVDNGMYSSKLITYDMQKMSFSEVNYNYIETEKVAQVQGASGTTQVALEDESLDAVEVDDTSGVTDTGKLCSPFMDMLNYPRQKIFLKPTKFGHDVDYKVNLKVAGGLKQRDIVPDHIENTFLQRKSQLQQLENIKLAVILRGNSNRQVGDLINFVVPSKTSPEAVLEGKEPELHKFYNGNYIATYIRHTLKKEQQTYTTYVHLSKNSLSQKMYAESGITSNPLPGTEETIEQEELNQRLRQTTDGATLSRILKKARRRNKIRQVDADVGARG